MDDLFYELFKDLPRQGPGDNISTKRAIDLIENLPENPNILDIGCGTGAQTIQLAHHIGGTVTAVDNHTPYLALLEEKSEQMGYSEHIRTLKGDIRVLDFPRETFDLIWAEGAIYVMGFKDGLQDIRKFLKPNGYVALTEISWLENSCPGELTDFWNQAYSGMNSMEQNLEIIESLKYKLIDYFILSPSSWWDDYYEPLEKRLSVLKVNYMENEQAMEVFDLVRTEIDMYRKYQDKYGNVFYIMQK